MPIYEYECKKCGEVFEMIQSFSDKPLNKCKKCGGGLHKLVSECSFHLKGTGWYVTDYGKSGKNKNAAQNTSKKDATQSKDGTGSTSKPKSEAKSADAKSSDSSAKKKTA